MLSYSLRHITCNEPYKNVLWVTFCNVFIFFIYQPSSVNSFFVASGLCQYSLNTVGPLIWSVPGVSRNSVMSLLSVSDMMRTWTPGRGIPTVPYLFFSLPSYFSFKHTSTRSQITYSWLSAIPISNGDLLSITNIHFQYLLILPVMP